MTSHKEFVEPNLNRNWRRKKNNTGKSYVDIPSSLHLQRSESAEFLDEEEAQ